MWGNLLGWCISAGMVIATVAGLLFLNRSLNDISPPTSFSATSGAANDIELPKGMDDLLIAAPGPADAASLYRQAITQYQSDPIIIDDFIRTQKDDELAKSQPTIDLLVQAAGNLPVPIFADNPAEIVNYKSETPLTNLKTLGDCLNTAALLAKLTDADKSRQEFEAEFSLGARLARERLTYAELSDGLGLMSGASIELASIEGDAKHAERAQAFNQFSTSLIDFTKDKLQPVQSVLSSIDPNIVDQYAGDVFWLASNSKCRMWRIEAILKLGRYKFDAPTKGDNRGAARVVSAMSLTATDPAIKAAATAARDLTLDQYQLLH